MTKSETKIAIKCCQKSIAQKTPTLHNDTTAQRHYCTATLLHSDTTAQRHSGIGPKYLTVYINVRHNKGPQKDATERAVVFVSGLLYGGDLF
jgi:hypothetical protein